MAAGERSGSANFGQGARAAPPVGSSRSYFFRTALLVLMGGFSLCYISILAVGHRQAIRFDDIASAASKKLLRGMPAPDDLVEGASVDTISSISAGFDPGGSTAVTAEKNLGEAAEESAILNSPEERERRRFIMFSDLEDLPSDKRGPNLYTSYQRSHVVQRADWFQGGIRCKDTCCVRRVAVSLGQDAEHLITTIDGVDLADVFVHGHNKQKDFEWVGTSLTSRMIPCLLPGTVVWADHEGGGVNKFFELFRPNITVPFVLISGETDGPEPMPPHGRKSLGSDDKLIKWYGINPSYRLGAHLPKFQMLNLGLSRRHRQQPDLQHLQRSRDFQNPFAGEAKKRWTESEALANATDTAPVLFVKFGINRHSQGRKKPYDMACDGRTSRPLDDISCNLGKTSSPQETYRAASKYLFGLSPPGLGNDCYRTYELLFLGVIPIVKKQPEYDKLFDGLPMIQLGSWEHSQADLLKIMRDYVASPEFRDSDFNGWERLYMKHWRQMLLKDSGREREVIEDPDGREYYQAYVYSDYTPPKINSWWPPRD